MRLFVNIKLTTAILTMAIGTLGGYAQDVNSEDSELPLRPQKQNYVFKHSATPQKISTYDCGIFFSEANKVYSNRGVVLSELGKEIKDVAISPAGINYIVISQDKKEPIAAMFSLNNNEGPIFKFKNKKLGIPSSATYTPDARQLLIATGKRLNVLDAHTFEVTDTMSIPFEPTHMSMSSNGYFVIMDNGSDVCIYNFEGKRPRHQMSFDEGVSSIKFNKDVTELGILTSDGVLSIYDGRTFLLKKSIDDLEGGIAFDFNFDGKYVAIATSPSRIEVINLLNTNDREIINVENGFVNDVTFVPDSFGRPILAYTSFNSINADRMHRLSPYYGKLVSEEANARLAEWAKMLPGETIEEYNLRVNDESRRRQLHLYEGEISTGFANDLLSMSTISLGKYDRTNQLLDVDFDNMPSILLPVPEADLGSFADAANLQFRNAQYGVMTDDSFELIYAEVYNSATGKTYTYDNLDRVPLSFVEGEDNVVAIEVIQQQQMEEMKLQEIRQQVMETAKQENVISDHTNIAVDSRIESDYDSDGNKILNYKVRFTYEVEPQFTAYEDFAPGKYRVEESGAAKSMLKIVKEAFEGDFAQYLKEGKKLLVKISGTADATPIVSHIKYDGGYGEFVDEPVYKDGVLSGLTVTSKNPVTENEQLAFLRAMGVKDHLTTNVDKLNQMNANYQYHIGVSSDKGSQFRRITTEFTFVDAF